MRTLGVGVVGVGTLGRFHASNLAHRIPRARLVAVADARPEVAREVAAELGVARVYSDAGALALDPDVEAMVIVSVDEVHFDGILAAATNKKDVFCEKPIAITLADADCAIAAAADAGVRLQIGFMRRYDPAYVAARRAIEAGAIGTPVLFKNAHRGKEPARRHGGTGINPTVFTNTNIHDYDDARWLLGDEAVEVRAIGTRIAAPGATEGVDCALTTVRFRRGTLADIEAVIGCGYGYDVRTEIIGDRGTIFVGSPAGTSCVVATSSGLHREATGHWLDRYGRTYLVELEDWVCRTLAGEPPAVTGRDGRAALEMAVAAQRSFAEGRPVALPVM